MQTIMKLSELSAFIKYLLSSGKIIHTTDDAVSWETPTGLAEIREHSNRGEVVGNAHASQDMLRFKSERLSKGV